MQSPQDVGAFRRIVRKLAEGAQNSELAIVVGNRAGVIEWANAAWARVTGYPIERFISKPVGDFIAMVDIEPGVVDLVGACFRENKVCEIDVPLQAPDGRQIWVHLRVEPLVDRSGDVTDFMATASDISERKRAETCAGLAEVDLSALAMRMAERYHDALQPMTSYDLSLDEDVPLVLADESLLEALVGRVICRAAGSIGRGWGTITLWSGVVGEGDGPLYCGNLWSGLPHGQYAFLEVHDTGSAPWSGAHRVIDEPLFSSRFPEHAMRISEARLLLHNQGGEIQIESHSSSGTSVVILLPYCSEHGLEHV